ncbi:MAG: glutamyl-tRNA reductase [Bacteroidota bacterium]
MVGFQAISLSHKNAPIEIRETVSFEGEEVSTFLIQLKEVFLIKEALLISTCNRTEIYYSSDAEISNEIIGFIASFKALSKESLLRYFRKLNTREAVLHLFRVALGLESKVLGDIQISNQIKRAYQSSADLELAGSFLHRLMHTIFYANKRVVQETRLQTGSASIASVAVELIKHFVVKLDNPTVALIGLGEIGQNTLENLNKENLKITLVNRTRSKAEKFASAYHVNVKDFFNLREIISGNDVIISAVSTKVPIINDELIVKDATHKLFIDLSVPRSIDPAIDHVPGVSLFNVDQLTEKTLKTKSIREKSIPAVEAIIEDALFGFDEWKSEMEVSPTIQRLKKTLDLIRKEELARYSKISTSERKLLEIATKNMIQKVIKLPVLQLKAARKRGEADTLVGVLNDLFDLEQQEINKR